MASKQINICWIRTGSHPYEKTISGLKKTGLNPRIVNSIFVESDDTMQEITILVWLQNQLISTGFILTHTEKSCIMSVADNFPRIFK